MSSNFNRTFSEYQHLASKTAIYPDSEKITYPTLGMLGEAGEIANKWKKVLRGDLDTESARDSISSEIGDVLWYLSALCTDLELNLCDIAMDNITKLTDRQNRDVLRGSGDKR